MAEGRQCASGGSQEMTSMTTVLKFDLFIAKFTGVVAPLPEAALAVGFRGFLGAPSFVIFSIFWLFSPGHDLNQ